MFSPQPARRGLYSVTISVPFLGFWSPTAAAGYRGEAHAQKWIKISIPPMRPLCVRYFVLATAMPFALPCAWLFVGG